MLAQAIAHPPADDQRAAAGGPRRERNAARHLERGFHTTDYEGKATRARPGLALRTVEVRELGDAALADERHVDDAWRFDHVRLPRLIVGAQIPPRCLVS